MTKTLVQLPKAIEPTHRHTMVRVGSQFDGGYVIAAPLLAATKSILTFGLGLNWDFERDMFKIEPQTKIHCYDHTINKQKLLRKYLKALLFFKTKPQKYATYISAYKDYGPFFDHNPLHQHFQLCIAAQDGAESASLKSALDKLAANGANVFLKCDIEGAEYEIADAIIANAVSFHGIALEFHDVFKRLDEVTQILLALSKTHNIDHIHANNMSKLDGRNIPSVIEVSLSRHDLHSKFDQQLIERFRLATSIDPLHLDERNAPDRPDMLITYF